MLYVYGVPEMFDTFSLSPNRQQFSIDTTENLPHSFSVLIGYVAHMGKMIIHPKFGQNISREDKTWNTKVQVGG